MALDNVHIGVKRKLAEAGINSDEIDGLNEMFNPYGPHGCLFKDLDTHYKHVKYCKTHLKYVVSEILSYTDVYVYHTIQCITMIVSLRMPVYVLHACMMYCNLVDLSEEILSICLGHAQIIFAERAGMLIQCSS